jgi:hypothetical protein
MTRREGLLAYFLVAAALIGALMSRAADTRKGDWTLHSSDEPGKVEFALIHTQHGNSSHHSSGWPLAAFVGLEFSKSGKQEVKFHITRDADMAIVELVGSEPTFKKQKDDKKARRDRKAKAGEKAQVEAAAGEEPSGDEGGEKDEK